MLTKLANNTITPISQTSKIVTPIVIPMWGVKGVGFGRNTTGGFGGTVYIVSNLNNSGSGSLRDYCENFSDTRIVYIPYELSGFIDLTNEINIQNDNITIWCDGNVVIRQFGFLIQADNVILHKVRLYGVNSPSDSRAGIVMQHCSNVLIDHCNIMLNSDDGYAPYLNCAYVTIQHSILAYATGAFSFRKAVLIESNANYITLYRNLFANGDARHPRIGTTDASETKYIDVVNNVLFNSGRHVNILGSDQSLLEVDVVANLFVKGNVPDPFPTGDQYPINRVGANPGSDLNIRIFDNSIEGFINSDLINPITNFSLLGRKAYDFLVTDPAYIYLETIGVNDVWSVTVKTEIQQRVFRQISDVSELGGWEALGI